MLRGIRYRAGRSLVVFLLAAAATTAAVLAPVYARAAQQSVLTDGLRSAPGDATTLVVSAKGSAEDSDSSFQDTDDIRQTLRPALAAQPALNNRVLHPVAAVDTDTTVTGRGEPLAARLAYRDGACAHLRITGHCPTDAGQVTMSARSAAAHGVKVGDAISVHLGSPSAGHDHRFVVTGVYRPEDSGEAYWGRTVYFAAGHDPAGGGERLDAMFTNVQNDIRPEKSAVLATRLEYPLDTSDIGLDDVTALRDSLEAFSTRVRGDDLDVDTALPAILTDAAADQRAIGRTAPVIAVPLLLLCWFVLFLLVASLTEERGPEIALAKLRGFPARAATRFGLGEALLLIAAATPVGLLAGYGLVEAAAHSVLAPGTAAQLRWPAFAAAGVALLGAVAAAVLAGRATVRRPVLALLRRVPARTRWHAGVAEGVVVALAAASLVAAVGDRSSPLALLAPPLLAVVAGIGTARVLGIWSRVRLAGARRRGKLVALLSSAQLSRRPGGQRVVVVVTVAVALLSFAATAWDVAAQARRDAAADALGASRVYTVAADHPDSLAAAVGRADPSGHTMAVARTSQRYGDGSIDLLGVQAARLPAVATWRGHDEAGMTALADRLSPKLAAQLPLSGGIGLTADVTQLPPRVTVRLAAVVSSPDASARPISLGPLVKGSHAYQAALPAECGTGCRLTGLALSREVPGPDPMTVALTVRGLGTGGKPLAAGLDAPGRWRAGRHTGQAQVAVKPQPGPALELDVNAADASNVVFDYVDSPSVVPVVLAGPAPADDARADAFSFPGLAEQPLPFQVVARSPVLPRTGGHGIMFDLDAGVRAAQRASGLADNDTFRYEVWAAPGAPADLGTRLARNGVEVLRTETLDGYLQQLGRRAPALGLWLYLLAGAAAILLAVGVVLLTAYVGVQGRLYELAALRVAGIRPSVLRRALLREYRLLLGGPLLVGLIAGVAGAVVMLPGVPLVTVGATQADVSYRPGPGALPAAVLLSVLGLGLAVLLVLRQLRRATPERLREGQR